MIKHCFLMFLLAALVALPVLAQEQQPASPQPAQQSAPQPSAQQPAQQPSGQQAESGDQDVRYTPEEYAAYQKATEEPDPAKKEDAILDFVKNNPKSSLVEYALSSYLQVLQDYQKQGDNARLAGAGDKLLAIRPDDARVMYMTGVAYFQSGPQQYQKAVELLEKVYAKQAEPQIAYMLAIAYGNPPGLSNDDKLIYYGEIASAKFPPNESYQILTQLMHAYNTKGNWAKASDYAKKTLAAFDAGIQKPQGIEQPAWDEYVSREKAIAYASIGRQSYERGNMQATIQNYKQALATYQKLPGLNAEAYYHIGLARWKSNDPNQIEPAMTAFAKGTLEKGAPHVKPCRQALEQLYKSQHNGSLAGIDEFIDEAKTRSI